MCTVLLPPGVNPVAVNKYIISYSSFYNFFNQLKHIKCMVQQGMNLKLSSEDHVALGDTVL